jgi:hypothetical protein
MFIVTYVNCADQFKSRDDAQSHYNTVCASGKGHVAFYQTHPSHALISEREPQECKG